MQTDKGLYFEDIINSTDVMISRIDDNLEY